MAMTLKEAIAHAVEVAETRTDLCEECRGEHYQLARWLSELEDFRSSNLIPEQVKSLKAKENWQDKEIEKLKAKVSELEEKHYSECRQIAHYWDELEKAKRLLRLALIDMQIVRNDECLTCGQPEPCIGCSCTEDNYKWRHAEEVKEFLRGA